MSKRFDRADGESRQLRSAYGDLGDRLSELARSLRGEIHDAHYPAFGLVSGMRRRAIIQRLKPLEGLFREGGERLFRWSSEIEAKLVYSIATEEKPDLPILFDQVRERRHAADQLMRAIIWRVKALQREPEMDTEAVFDFCQMAERAALYLQLASVALFLPSSAERAAVRDPRFLDLDWDEIEAMARDLPLAFRTEVVREEANDREAALDAAGWRTGSRRRP